MNTSTTSPFFDHSIPEGNDMKKRSWMAVALLLAACGLSACERSDQNQPPVVVDETATDSVTLSFVFVGCNRVGWSQKGHPKLPLPPSTANKAQLLQTFKDIKALPRAPEYLFFLGDLVRNEVSGETLQDQLALWQGLWDNGALANGQTTLVPITGNHEVLKSVQYAHKAYYEVPDPGSNTEWLKWLNTHQHVPQPGNGPTPANDPNDLLRGDNSQQTYSFDAQTSDGKQVHFVVLDTDTESSFSTTDSLCYQSPQQGVKFNNKTVEGTMSQDVPGWIPLDWVKQDLSSNSQSDLIFAFGHKPIVYPSTSDPNSFSDGRDTIFNCGQKMLAKELVTAFQGTDNFVAYLGAHKHLWDAFQIQNSVWQVIAGDGGSELDRGDSFGFTLVEIHKSGKVIATPFTRPVPDPYYSSQGVTPARYQPGSSPTPIPLKGPGQ